VPSARVPSPWVFPVNCHDASPASEWGSYALPP
jgi:hypothetical protein